MRLSKYKAPDMIGRMSDETLLQSWEATARMKFSEDLATVRGWLMDELSDRYTVKFDEWVISDDDDMALRHYIYR